MLSTRARIFFVFSTILCFLGSSPAFAGVEHLSEAQFRQLAIEVAPKVNLFRDTWDRDPRAQFFGGTVRDYLYWLRGKFRDADSAEEAQKIVEDLRARSRIDLRDFMIPDSDIDVVTAQRLDLSADAYGIKKIDYIQDSRFDPATDLGRSELEQGFIPVEKIRLGRTGFVDGANFGDGVGEIYRARPTLHLPPPEVFEKTYYARQKLNHQALIGVRYIRSLAINYYQQYGKSFPDEQALMDIDPASLRALQSAAIEAKKPGALKPYLKQDRFRYWMNETIKKTFRSETNPTAAHRLFEHFGFDQVVKEYGGVIEPINQYLFAKPKISDEVIRAKLRALGTTPEELFRPAAKELPDLTLYHGTKTEERFVSILAQGVMPSTGGLAGPGLYVVNQPNVKHAVAWAQNPDLVVRFEVKPEARILDATKGKGRELLQRFTDYEKLAEATGADLIFYENSFPAYVVKNSAMLDNPTGYNRQFMSFGRLLDRAKVARDLRGTLQVFKSMQLNHFTAQEVEEVMDRVPFLQTADGAALRAEVLALNRLPFPSAVKLSAMQAIASFQNLAREAKGLSLAATQALPAWNDAATAVNGLGLTLSKHGEMNPIQRNDLLKRIAISSFDPHNPEGNTAVRSALVHRVEKFSPDFLRRIKFYAKQPVLQAAVGLSVPVTAIFGLMHHFDLMSGSVATVAMAVPSLVAAAAVKDANLSYQRAYEGLNAEARQEQATAIKGLQKYFQSLEKGKELRVSSPRALKVTNTFNLISSCPTMYRKLWHYDQNLAVLVGGAGLVGTYSLIQYLLGEE